MSGDNGGEKKAGFIKRHIIGAPKEAIKGALLPKEVGAGKELIKDLAGRINPARYKPSEFSSWANPAKSEISFRQAMKNAGVTEEDVSGRHKIFALSVYACLTTAMISVALGVREAAGGEAFFGAAVGGSGLVLSSALFFKYSLAALQIRKRNLNIGWREWLSLKWEWIPPYSAPIPKKRLVKRVPAEPTQMPLSDD